MCEKWVNNAKFVTFNTIFSKKYHCSSIFFFKFCLANILGSKIKEIYQKHWWLMNGDENSQFHSVFSFSNNYPNIFLCFLAVLRCVNNFREKKIIGVWLFSQEIQLESSLKMQKIFILGSLSSIQHYLPIYFSANFVRKCSILAHNEKIMLGIYSSKIIQSCQSGQNRVKPQHAISEEPSIFEQKIFCNFSYGLSTYNTKKMKELVVVTSTNSQIMTLNRFMLKVYLCNKSIF